MTSVCGHGQTRGRHQLGGPYSIDRFDNMATLWYQMIYFTSILASKKLGDLRNRVQERLFSTKTTEEGLSQSHICSFIDLTTFLAAFGNLILRCKLYEQITGNGIHHDGRLSRFIFVSLLTWMSFDQESRITFPDQSSAYV